MKNCNYTIIIPHKNIPALLQRCLDSIPVREDLQVIVVDDNSSPDVVDFSCFPGSDRQDVEIIYTKEGKGAGFARNCGMEHSAGKWLLFADADDFFMPGFLDILDEYCCSDYDLVTFRAESMDSETLMPLEPRQENYADISENMDLEILKYRNDPPWAKMVSHRLVQKHHLLFDEMPAANDAMFSAYVDYYAEKVAASSQSVYCATVRSGSLQYSAVLPNLLARVSVACRYNRFLNKIGRKDKYVYSYSRVIECRKDFGKDGYRKALRIYLCTECPGNIYITFRDLLKDKIKHIFATKIKE